MISIKSSKRVLISFFVIIVIAAIFPFRGPDEGISLVLTVSTFLFGIFGGFILANRFSRYTRFRELLTNETGYLISFYNYAKIIDKKLAEKVSQLIDDYIVEGFLYEVYEYHKKTETSFYNIFNAVKDFKVINPEQASALFFLGNMNAILKDVSKDREEIYLLEEERISFLFSLTLLFLGGIILFCLFYIKADTIGSYLLTILLSMGVVIILFLIRDLDKMQFADEAISYGIYFRIFDAIGKPKLYTSDAIKNGRLKLPEKGVYRYAVIERKNGMPFYEKIKLVNK